MQDLMPTANPKQVGLFGDNNEMESLLKDQKERDQDVSASASMISVGGINDRSKAILGFPLDITAIPASTSMMPRTSAR